MKRRVALALAALGVVGFSAAALAVSEGEHPHKLHWPFDGMFGVVDKQSAQRGLQVYKEVCASCHSLNRVAFRNLTELGFSEAETKALAATYTYQEIGDDGQPFDRPGKPSDHFKPPFPNEQAARASNGGTLPPDLSLIIKARHDGANYLYSLLNGYGKQPPADLVISPGLYYNPYFPGQQIAMPPPLTADGQVAYEDGTAATVDQMSRDLVNFLQWAAEPEMEQRKAMGLKVVLFLAIMAAFFFASKRRIWKDLH